MGSLKIFEYNGSRQNAMGSKILQQFADYGTEESRLGLTTYGHNQTAAACTNGRFLN
ncbi:hypothetical protein INT80_09210 [Gallibacterium anatis]|uniref:Uncharacterized protein n=1 Tax=Gallibacterium anatis TaxID=750 RepID=A0A930URP6_9PAST|nr:hypothetical protein [Gallibacterium anatis]